MNLAQLTKDWLDSPFQEVSCIAFVVRFLRQAGKAVPDAYGGLSVDTYYDAWRRDPAAVERHMVRAIVASSRPSSVRCPRLLDMLVIRHRKPRRTLFPAVYVGGGKAISCFIKSGVRVFALDRHNRAIVARRFD